MDTYYLLFEVAPQADNPITAHASRAVVHLWLVAADLEAAKKSAADFLLAERGNCLEEKKAELLTADQIEGLSAEERTCYEAAQTEGPQAKFYYWHRSE